MPIIIDCEQRSDIWFAAICGNVGASNIDKIITTKGEPSKSRTDYMMSLAAERITGKGEGGFTTQSMLNGIEREAEARLLFEMSQDIDVKQVGLVYKDETKMAHCSPDGLIGDCSGVEIKSPMSKTQIKYLLNHKLPIEYFCQVQFSLYVTERESWFFFSYYPGLRPFMEIVYRDEKWIEKCEKELNQFNEELLEMVERIR